ncbi:MAG: helix-turn-helix transcriptional regulator [Paludibacteraceae bacterium]|nr:helix-turn-helix transcriptional regulator [Paludibacteraceae bacterium]
MSTIAFFFSILPWGILLLETISFSFRSNKTRAQKMFMGLLFASLCFSVYDLAYFLPEAPAAFIGKVDIFGHVVTPMLIFLLFRYLYFMHKPNRDLTRINYITFLALALGIICTLPYIIVGRDKAKDFWRAYMNTGLYPEQFIGDNAMHSFYTLDIIVFHSICILGLLGVVAYIIWCLRRDKSGIRQLWEFQWHHQEIKAFHLHCWLFLLLIILCIVHTVLGRSTCIEHPVLAMVLSYGMADVIYLICMLGPGIDAPDFTIDELLHPQIFRLPNSQEMEAFKSRENPINAATEAENQKERLTHLMTVERLFTDATLTVDDLAIKMNTSRLFVTNLISSTYGVSFRDYLHKLRIDYSKELMAANPFMLQEDIAKQCGYNDAATFNKRFRIQEGVTPKQWRVIQGYVK